MGMDIWFEERLSKTKFNDKEIAYWRNKHHIIDCVEQVTGEKVENEDKKEIPVNITQMLGIQGILLKSMNEADYMDQEMMDDLLYDLNQIAKCLVFLSRNEYIWFSASW